MSGDSTKSDISEIGQFDGNVSVPPTPTKIDKITASLHLPTIASYNCRSAFPKIESLKTDLKERAIDVGFLTEIWEQKQNKIHQYEVEKMLELMGLQYISTVRSPNRKGVSYGGAAIVVNLEKFTCEKLKINTPYNLEVVWGLIRPKSPAAKFKKIIACCFYSPPSKRSNTNMADHIVTTLQMLSSKYPGSGLIIGADKNYMDIRPILTSGLRLRQIVDKPTRQGQILDVLITNLSGLYNTPYIAPPLQPDDPSAGRPSDHSVPVAAPHTDRFRPAERQYRIIKFRPLPESSVRNFGAWIVSEQWDSIKSDMSPTEQALELDKILGQKINQFCPEKQLKVSTKDKQFITAELKILSRQKMREYNKRGKTPKYKKLEAEFKSKYKTEAKKFLKKSMDTLRESNPGKAYCVLKKMGAQPGDCIDSNTFTLPNHESESLTVLQSCERIAQHFANISQEYPALDINLLPERVKIKLQASQQSRKTSGSVEVPPTVSEFETFRKLSSTKKPRSGVPTDLPKLIVKEFSPELALPVSRIINSILSTGEWPRQWKLEHVTPIGKVPTPETEDDLRPISLTPFFSKVTEQFIVMWLMEYIKDKIDFRQYGGQRGNSITHYLIEFINFILSSQDSADQTAILAVMVDFSKAFNRQNHNLLITKLSDMGVPAWLLSVVIAFLTDRRMLVRYKGKESGVKPLPGGGPQGTLLGLLLFIILINDVGFEDQLNNIGEVYTRKNHLKKANEIHLKYVDDLTLAEAVNLPTQLEQAPDGERERPDNYHSRTGHTLPLEKSKVFKELVKTKEYANTNEMKINMKKTKVMLFNPCSSLDFQPNIELDNHQLEIVEEMRLLGVHIRSDMKWHTNTEQMVKKAYKRLWIIRRLKSLGAAKKDLVDIYEKHVRCVLELAVPAWHGSITQKERVLIERVQKCAVHIILGQSYNSYKLALDVLQLESLEARRTKLCIKFVKKAEKHEKFANWFKLNDKRSNTRLDRAKYCDVWARHTRFQNSPISFLTRLLNQYHRS